MVSEFAFSEQARAMEDGVRLPTVGPVYTIRDIEPGIGWNKNSVFLRFLELSNLPYYSNGKEPSFDAELFRAVVERKTDISVFKSMLNPFRELQDHG